MSNKLLYHIFGFFFILHSFAQKENDSLQFTIHSKWKNEPFQLNKKYVSHNDTIQINLVKFYLSNFKIEYQDGTFFKEKESYHLIDFEKPKSLKFSLEKINSKKIKALHFAIGIDSLTSVSGAMAGKLDVTQGMYWAWQSGYINLKIEGKNNNCTTRNHKFQYHIGGYMQPYYALREVSFLVNSNNLENNTIYLNFDIEKLFNIINSKEFTTIMIPGKDAMKFADVFQKIVGVE